MSQIFARASRAVKFCCALGLAGLVSLSGGAMAQAVLPSPNVVLLGNASARQMVQQPDGKLIVLGDFGVVDGVAGDYGIIRLNANGTRDPSFNVTLDDGGAFKLLISGNFLYILGQFSQVNGVSISQLARVNYVTGQLDTNWRPNPIPRTTGQVAVGDITVDPAGNIYTFGSLYDIGGKTNVRSAKLLASSPTGQADPAYSGAEVFPSGQPTEDIVADRIVWSAARGGSVFVLGSLAGGSVGPQSRRVHRIDPSTGLNDPSWSPNLQAIDLPVYDVIADASGDLYISGQRFGLAVFGTTYTAPNIIAKIRGSDGQPAPGWSRPPGNVTQTTPDFGAYYGLAHDGQGSLFAVGAEFYSDTSAFMSLKLDASTGAIDSSFSPTRIGAGGRQGAALVVASDGLFWAADATYANGARAGPILKLNRSTGAAVAGFAPSLRTVAQVSTSTRLADGRVVFGGSFQEVFDPLTAPNFVPGTGLAVNNLLRLNADGSLDRTFTSGPQGLVLSLKEINGRLYAGGAFYVPGRTGLQFLARYDSNSGALDSSWNPTLSGSVRAIAGVGNAIFIQGGVSSVNGVSTRCLAKLDATTGAPDANFQPAMVGTGFGNFCSRAMVAAGGFIYSGLPNNSIIPGQAPRYVINGNQRSLAKIDAATGVIDPSFDPNPRLSPTATFASAILALEHDGTNLWAILTTQNPAATIGAVNTRVAKINPLNGAVDPNFVNMLNDSVLGPLGPVQIRVAPTGVYIAGNAFNSSGNFANVFMRRLSLTNGAFDAAWSPALEPGDFGFNAAIEPLLNNLVAIGGSFVRVNGQLKAGVAVMSAAPTRQVSVTLVGGRADIYVFGGPPGYSACQACAPGTYSWQYDAGSNVRIEVRPLPGFAFGSWSAGTGGATCTGATPVCSFTLNAASSITATLTSRPGIWFAE
jgi:hypothetical protein